MPPQSQYRRMRYHRRVSEQDRWLDDKGLYRKHIVTDSSCLFRIVSEYVYKIQSYHMDVRNDCVQYMIHNEDTFKQMVEGSYMEYVTELAKSDSHGGLVDIAVMSHMYRYDFAIYDNSKGPETYVSNGFDRMILLYHIKEKNHFDVLYSKEYMGDVSFCQSLLYGVLYQQVFKMVDVDYAVKKMLYGKDNNSIDYYMPESVLRRTSNQLSKLECNNNKKKHNGAGDICTDNNNQKDDSEVINFTLFPMDSGDSIMIALDTNNAKEMLDNKILPFPYKVAKALDPNIYRNVELDSWYEIKKDEQPSGQYFDGLSLQVGVKCLCSLNPNSSAAYHCHIQDMKGEDGPCVVFVEELGEMRTVSMSQLKPLPAEEAKPWYTPYKKERAKFYSIAGILRQLGYVGIANNYKFKYKLKKAGGIGQELAQLKENIDWMNGKNGDRSKKYFEKFNLRNHAGMEDKDKNVEVMWDEDANDTYITTVSHYYDIETYTKVDLDNFSQYKVEMVTMPLVVEPNNSSPTSTSVDNAREPNNNSRPTSVTFQGNQQEQGVSTPLPYPLQNASSNELSTSPGYATNTPISGAPVTLSPVVPHSGNVVWSSGGTGMYNTYPLYCTPPHGSSMPPLPPPPPVSFGPLLVPPRFPVAAPVNFNVQKSMDSNGADLPYNDMSTLRFFFNLGVECVHRGWAVPPPSLVPHMPMHTVMPPGGPQNTPTHSNYSHTPNRISPAQLAIELQQNLVLEDNNGANPPEKENNPGNNHKVNNGGPHNNNTNMQQRGKGGVEYGGNRRSGTGGGGFGGRYRGGNNGNNHKNANYNNRNHYNNFNRNNNHSHNPNNKTNNHNSNNKGNMESEGSNANEQGKELAAHQHPDNSGHQLQAETSFGNNPNMSFISIPPPPIYRVPYYSVDTEGSMIYPTQYLPPYLPMPDDTVSSTSESSFIHPCPPPYMGYMPTPPPIYCPPMYSHPPHFAPTAAPDANQPK